MKDVSLLKKIVFYISFPLYFLNFMFPIMAINLGSSALDLGILFSTLSILSLFAKPLIGKFIDRKGPSNSIIIGSILYAITLFLLYLCRNYEMLLICSIFKGVSSSFIWLGIDNIVIESSNSDNISTNSGKVEKWTTSGSAIGSFIGFTLFFNDMVNNFNSIFIVYVPFILISLGFTLKTLHNYQWDSENITSKECKNIRTKKLTFFSSLESFNKCTPKLKLYCLILFIGAFGGSMFSPVFLSYLGEKLNYNYFTISYLYLPGTFICIVFADKIGTIIDKLSKKKFILFSTLATIVYWIVFPNINSFYSLLILYTLISVIYLCESLTSDSIRKDLVENENKGTKIGFMSLFSGIGATLGSTMGGALYDFNGITIVVLCIIAVSIIQFLLYIGFFKNSFENSLFKV